MTQTDKQAHTPTPTPWHTPPDDLAGQAQLALEGLPPFPGRAIVGANGVATCVVLTAPPSGDANARRIVAAVNACEGISTEALEAGVVADLLAACEELSQTTTRALMYQRLDRQPHVLNDIQVANEQAKAVIIKAKGE